MMLMPAPCATAFFDHLQIVEMQRHLDRHFVLAQIAFDLALDRQIVVEADERFASKRRRRN